MKAKRGASIIALVMVAAVCIPATGASALSASSLINDNVKTVTLSPLANTILKNDKASIDVTNTADGYVNIAYTGGGTANIKVILTGPKGTEYRYNLNNKGTYETFPLSEGDGKYKVGVHVNTSGNKYSTAYSTEFTVKLKDQFAPFLVSNQYVNFTSASKAVKLAAAMTKDVKEDLKKLEAIYNYVIENLTYDKDKAADVTSGKITSYLPDIDKVLDAKKGICFDYAALMAAMLRSQGIPCKLVTGYTKDGVYHAWINAYLESVGWVDGAIYFDGKNWKLMDPTFASNGKSSDKTMEYIGDGKNYTAKLYY